MLCDRCHKKDAKILYTEIINGKKKEQHLCEDCATNFTSFQIENPSLNSDLSLGELLSSMLSNYYKEKQVEKQQDKEKLTCNHCNTSYEELMHNGRFGCAECYKNFYDEIERMLKGIQGANVHIGKRPNGFKGVTDQLINELTEIDKLNIKLQDAIKDERYEDAANFRDQIKRLKDVEGAKNA